MVLAHIELFLFALLPVMYHKLLVCRLFSQLPSSNEPLQELSSNFLVYEQVTTTVVEEEKKNGRLCFVQSSDYSSDAICFFPQKYIRHIQLELSSRHRLQAMQQSLRLTSNTASRRLLFKMPVPPQTLRFMS